MSIKDVKVRKYVAFILGISILLSTLFITTGIAKKKEKDLQPKAIGSSKNLSKDDRKTAEEISNMTGLKAEEILNIRNQGKTWNQVLEDIKSKDKSNGNLQQENDRRNKLLSESEIGKEYVEKLKKEGFKDQEITETKMLVERVLFQLDEITSGSNMAEKDYLSEIPTPGVNMSNEEKEDINSYSELIIKIDKKTAIFLLLKLKGEFGSIEMVFDEYLLSLQLDLSFENYLIDKESYLEEKEKKNIERGSKQVITIEKIESKMLERLKTENSNKKDRVSGAENISDTVNNKNKSIDESKVPEPPLPDIQDPKPKDPLDEEMKEINAIKEKSLNIEGR